MRHVIHGHDDEDKMFTPFDQNLSISVFPDPLINGVSGVERNVYCFDSWKGSDLHHSPSRGPGPED